MEVLRKYGTKNVTCPNCNSDLLLEVSDVKPNDCGQVHHGIAAGCSYYATCPVCRVIIPVSNVPKLWQKEIG